MQRDEIHSLKSYFNDLVKNDLENAINFINHDNLNYCSLFLLQPEITELGISSRLNERNRKALELTSKISAKKSADVERLERNKNSSTYSTLKWIFETGCLHDGLDNRYDELLELTAALLVKSYKDSSILPAIGDMIFKRYKKGLLIHHLVWAFFESRVPYSLTIIANRLLSNEHKDIELACKLLGFIPCMNNKSGKDRVWLYYNAIHWINDNYRFMHYTGESFHHTADPIPYVVSCEAKYLCKPVPDDGRKPPDAYTEDEGRLIRQLNGLDTDTRILLSDCSFFLYRRNPYWWNTWIHYPVLTQIHIARTMAEGSL